MGSDHRDRPISIPSQAPWPPRSRDTGGASSAAVVGALPCSQRSTQARCAADSLPVHRRTMRRRGLWVLEQLHQGFEGIAEHLIGLLMSKAVRLALPLPISGKLKRITWTSIDESAMSDHVAKLEEALDFVDEIRRRVLKVGWLVLQDLAQQFDLSVPPHLAQHLSPQEVCRPPVLGCKSRQQHHVNRLLKKNCRPQRFGDGASVGAVRQAISEPIGKAFA